MYCLNVFDRKIRENCKRCSIKLISKNMSIEDFNYRCNFLNVKHELLILIKYICNRGLPLITYGRGGVKFQIHFHCVLHAKRGGGGPDSM